MADLGAVDKSRSKKVTGCASNASTESFFRCEDMNKTAAT